MQVNLLFNLGYQEFTTVSVVVCAEHGSVDLIGCPIKITITVGVGFINKFSGLQVSLGWRCSGFFGCQRFLE